MRDRVAVLGRVLARRSLRRVALAFGGFGAAELGVWTAMLVYAYGRGGARTAALIAVVQLVPAALVAPPAATIADTRGGPFALRLGYILQAAAMGATAVVLLAGLAPVVAYVSATVAASAVTITRPAQAATVVALVEHPDELTAATALSSWIEGASLLVGPAVAGILIAADGPGLAFAVFAGLVALGAVLVSSVSAPPRHHDSDRTEPEGGKNALAGLTTLRSAPDTRAVLGVLAVQYIALGALDVLEVVIAISVLGLGPPFAGYLGAAFGAGGLLGGAVALNLIGARSIAKPLAGAALLWAVAYTALGLRPTAFAAFLLLLVAGGGHAVLDTAGRTLLARIATPELLARVFGVLEGLTMLGLAIGSLLVPPLVSLGGARAALIGIAAILAVATLAWLPRLLTIDNRGAPAATLRLLQSNDLFAALPGPALESLAGELRPIRVHNRRVVIREGERGDSFFLIDRGEVEVSVAGEPIRRLGPGGSFGEIALLHNVLRTATVTATRECLLYALAREPFLDALIPAV